MVFKAFQARQSGESCTAASAVCEPRNQFPSYAYLNKPRESFTRIDAGPPVFILSC